MNDADDIMLSEEYKEKKKQKEEKVDIETFKEKDILDKIVDRWGLNDVKKILSGNIKPFIRPHNLANPLHSSEYDGEGSNNAIEAGISISF